MCLSKHSQCGQCSFGTEFFKLNFNKFRYLPVAGGVCVGQRHLANVSRMEKNGKRMNALVYLFQVERETVMSGKCRGGREWWTRLISILKGHLFQLPSSARILSQSITLHYIQKILFHLEFSPYNLYPLVLTT